MATPLRKTHFIIALLATWIDSLKRTVAAGGAGGVVSGASGSTTPGAGGGTAPAFTGTSVVVSGYQQVINPIAPDLISVVAALDPPVDGAMVIAAQPATACKLQVRIVGAITGNLVLVGVGARGQAVGQTIDLSGGTRTVITANAYAIITSATLDTMVAAGGDSVGIGQSSALGLAVPQGATGITVYRAETGATANALAREAVGTVDATEGTIVPTTAPDGSKEFAFWWAATVPITGSVASHTHTGAAHTHAAGTYAASPASGAFHYDRGEYTIATTNASSLSTSRALLKAFGVAYHQHVNDALAHDAIDSDNDIIDLSGGETLQAGFLTPVGAAALTGSGSLCSVANEIKAAYNLHMAQAGVHPTDDATNTIAAADATDQNSLNTLLNELKADFNLHIANGFATPSWRVLAD